MTMTVGYGCELCIRDGDLLVCTERCGAATPGYTEIERRRVMTDRSKLHDLADQWRDDADLAEQVANELTNQEALRQSYQVVTKRAQADIWRHCADQLRELADA